MGKIIKYLRPFVWSIIAIFLLLFGQAMADLSLPAYMSDIVNIGVQAGGIENAVPQAVRAAEYNKLTLFMKESEKAQVAGDYVLLDKAALSDSDYAGFVKTYPALADEPIYKLNTSDKEEIAQLDIIFRQAVIIVATIEKSGFSSFPGGAIQVPEGVDPFTMLAQLPPAQLEAIRKMAVAQLEAIPDTLLKQYATPYLTAEYTALGMNLSGIQSSYIWRIGLLMLMLTLAGTLASIIVGYLSARIAAGMGKDLRRRMFVRVAAFSNTEFDKFSTASLITRSTNDITQIMMVMVMLFRILFYAPIIGIGGILRVLNADTSMLWIIAAAVGAMLMLMGVMFIVVLPKFTILQKLVDKLNLVMREILNGLMVIRAFNTQEHEEKKFDGANTDLMKTSLFINRVMVLMMPVMMFIMNGVMLLIVWVGAHQVDAGTTQVGDLMAFMQYAMMIIMAFMMVTVMFIMVPRASVSAVRISEVLETELIIKNPAQPQSFDAGLKGVVEFRDVSFRYPGAEDNVLENITFKAMPGQTTALIGSTGSGKSTLINLIPRFYDVNSGAVLVDGIDVRNVRQEDLREKIGYVSQNAVLFSGTIASNIKYANEALTDEQIAPYAQTAQAMDFITVSDHKFETAVSQGGSNLSGGQKQRLSIARALAKRPEIYIFDDALSALDFRTDAALRRALKKETKDATVMIVTQRVSTIMGAEQIIVLDDGKVAGIGTHRELMKDCEVYREIAQSQLSREELV